MDVKTQGVFLKSIKYSDSSNIIKIFTREHGVLAFMVRGVHRKKSNIKPSYLLPSSLLNIEIRLKEDKNLQTLVDVSASPNFIYEPSDMIKTGIYLMMAESIQKILLEKIAEKEIFDFYKKSVIQIGNENKICALFPQYFLLNIAKLLGLISPDNIGNGFQLNMQQAPSGVRATTCNTPLQKVLEAKYDNLKNIRVEKAERKKLMGEIIMFYKQEVSDVFCINTLEVMPLVI